MTKTAERRYAYEDLSGLLSLMSGDEKHGPAATSTLDALWVLYDRVLRVTPERMGDPERDRFLLSKGHGPMAYYAVLAAKGFLPVEWLPGFGSYTSPLGHHPDRVLVPGAEIGSGSLGHGLPIAVGTALGLRAQGLYELAVWVLVGDAELDEGSNHEAIAYSGPAGLDRLHTVVIDDSPATHARPGGIAARFEGARCHRVVRDDRTALRRGHAASRHGDGRHRCRPRRAVPGRYLDGRRERRPRGSSAPRTRSRRRPP